MAARVMAPASLQLQDSKETEILTSASEQQKIQGEHAVVRRELGDQEEAEIILEPAASQQEIAPAAPAEQQNEEKEAEVEALVRWNKIVLAPPDSQEKAMAVEIRKEVLSLLYFLRGTNSEIMQPVGHLATDDCEREALNFIDMELSIIEASMMLRRPSPREHQFYEHKMVCLDDSMCHVLDTYDLLASYHHHVDTRRHTLLHKAAQWLLGTDNISSSRNLLADTAICIFRLAQDPCRYQKLLFSSPEHGLPVPPDMTKPTGGHRLVGTDRPMEKMIRWLTGAAEDLRTLSIVGSAGMGKTALAMSIYHKLQCSFQFSCASNFSRRPDRSELLLQHILSQISGTGHIQPAVSPSDQSQTATLEHLLQRISECLQDKRYFILIDDLWESSDWQKIEAAFPKNGRGSRILITSRVRDTAWSCCSYSEGIVHEMKPLNETDSETLLLTTAFGSVSNGCSSPSSGNLKLLCDEILRRCQGTPLFLAGMAGWLKDQHHQTISKSCNMIEQIPKALTSFEQVVSSIYNDLPHESHQLKMLLLYMSMFPLGYMFDMDRLVTKWESEGLNHSDGLLSQYFLELVARSLITPVLLPGKSNHNPHEGDEAGCQWQVNSFILQFLSSISAEKGLVYTIDTLSSLKGRVKNRMIIPRRLALHRPMLPSLFEGLDLSETRSLAVSGAVDVIPLDKFVYLVVLDLEGWENLNDESMKQICSAKMFLLTHLSIRNTAVSNLPPQIKELSRLRILDASRTQISKLPSEVGELEYLHKLDLRSTQIKELRPNEILWPQSLQHLLVGGEGTINAVSAETATTIPEDICRVGSLKTLATVDLSKSPASFLNALGDLRKLMVLALTWSFDQCANGIAYHEAFLSSIKKWQLLESLSLHCGLGCSMEFLESLNDPPSQLQKFKVTGARFVGVPKWIGKTNALSSVQITVCRLHPDDLKILESLPKLKCLIIGLEFIPREAIVIGSEGFTELLRFTVDCPMPWLTFTAGATRKLTCLQLKVCSGPGNKHSVPSGICNLQRLSEVVLTYKCEWSWCANSSSVKEVVNAVKQEVAKHPNPVSLIINGTIHDVEVAEKTQRANVIQGEIKAGDEKQSQMSCPDKSSYTCTS